MPLHDDLISMRHMLDYAREAVTLCAAKRRKDLTSDRLLELGLTRIVEVIGEAASRVSPATRERFAMIPWKIIVGTRNRLIHGYDAIDLDVLWDTVRVDLPNLIPALESALSQFD